MSKIYRRRLRRRNPPKLRIKITQPYLSYLTATAYLGRRKVGQVTAAEYPKSWEIEGMKVHQDFRRQGIATKLYLALADYVCGGATGEPKPLLSQGWGRSPDATQVWEQIPGATPIGDVEGRDSRGLLRRWNANYTIPCDQTTPQSYSASKFGPQGRGPYLTYLSRRRNPEEAWENPDEEDYTGSHEAPGEEGAPLHNLLEGGTFPSDVYTHMRYYQFHDAALESQAERTIRHFRGKPDGKVRIYRAVPEHVSRINTGDWVTIVKDYAIEHSGGEDFKIISARVPARMVYTNGDSLMEWGYVGPRRVSREHLRPNPLRGDRLERWLERKVLARAATRAEVRKLIQILARSHQPEKIYNLFHLLPSEDYRWAAHQYWLARWGSRSYLELRA